MKLDIPPTSPLLLKQMLLRDIAANDQMTDQDEFKAAKHILDALEQGD